MNCSKNSKPKRFISCGNIAIEDYLMSEDDQFTDHSINDFNSVKRQEKSLISKLTLNGVLSVNKNNYVYF